MQLVTSAINFIFRQRINGSPYPDDRLLSVLIPARNEEENIGLLLSDLRSVKSIPLEILVFDDQSTDGTARVVMDYAQLDPRIRLIRSDGLPDGWLGKNHACHQLSRQATGTCYLFIDADVRLTGEIIREAAGYLDKHNLGLLSFFPTQILKTFGEKASVPIMNYILLTLLPLIFVRISPFRSHAAANGQFMLFHAATYKRLQPHERFKNSAVEDIAIARFFKQERIKVACLTGDTRVRCRMYRSYQEALNGFSRNVFMFFGNRPALGFAFWFIVLFGFIPVWISLPQYLIWYVAGVVATLLLYSLSARQKIQEGILLFPFHLLFLFLILVNGVIFKARNRYSWKGRDIC